MYDGKAFVKPQKKIKPQGPTLYEKVREREHSAFEPRLGRGNFHNTLSKLTAPNKAEFHTSSHLGSCLSNPHGAQTLRGFRAWRHHVIEFQVKTRYDMILSEMSEAKHARNSSKWVRGFFDTKVDLFS